MFIDLHRHIEGSISPHVTEKIGQPLSCRWTGAQDFFSVWGPIFEYLSTPARYGEVARHSLDELASIGTRYVEFQFSPSETSVDPLQTAIAINEAFANARQNRGIQGGLIYTITRHLVDTIEKDCERALDLFERGLICGVGLAGDEVNFPIRALAGRLKKIIDAPIPKTFHAGEFGGCQEIADALMLGATRIGHGNHLVDDPDLLARVQAERVGIEVCITSELLLKNVQSWEVHPLQTFLEKRLLFNLNTDDPAIFGTEIDQEYEITRGLVSRELLYRNGIEMAFAPAHIKDELLASCEG